MARQPEDTTKSKPGEKSVDSALIRELAKLLDETNLTEIEIERAGLRVRVGRGMTAAATPVVNVTGPASVVSAATPADPAKHPGAVTSPMVGTAYFGPAPRAKPFV